MSVKSHCQLKIIISGSIYTMVTGKCYTSGLLFSGEVAVKEQALNIQWKKLMLNLKFQYFGHLMQRADSLEKTLMLGKIEGKRRRRWQRMRWLDGITDPMDMSLSKIWKMVKDREAWHAALHRGARSQTQLNDWTTKKQYNDELVDLPLSVSAQCFLADLQGLHNPPTLQMDPHGRQPCCWCQLPVSRSNRFHRLCQGKGRPSPGSL